MIRLTPRTSRKTRRCERCARIIEPAERYIEAVASPQHDDLGNSSWWRLAECAECSNLSGAGHLLTPLDSGEPSRPEVSPRP